MITDIKINKPAPIAITKNLKTFKHGVDVRSTIEALEAGKPLLITDFYSNGISLLQDLHQHLKIKLPNKSFKEQRKYRSAYHKLSNLILIEIIDHKLSVKKSPTIGWLEIFYPDNNNFLLTFPQVQGLNSAWQWYQNGISIPVSVSYTHLTLPTTPYV